MRFETRKALEQAMTAEQQAMARQAHRETLEAFAKREASRRAAAVARMQKRKGRWK